MKTTPEQILRCPYRRVYVCGSQRDADSLAFVARTLNRSDLRFVSMFWLTSAKLARSEAFGDRP